MQERPIHAMAQQGSCCTAWKARSAVTLLLGALPTALSGHWAWQLLLLVRIVSCRLIISIRVMDVLLVAWLQQMHVGIRSA
jgi:hypothetical protein